MNKVIKLFLIFFLLTISCFNFSKKDLLFSKANIILISLDTTRADHLSCYGYKVETSPNIDSVAKDGILIRNVISQVPLTLPSHASVFTGLLPIHHKIRDNGGYYLERKNKTIAEILSENDYFTIGFIGSFVLNSKWGIGKGFKIYDDKIEENIYRSYSFLSIERSADIVVKRALDILKKNKIKEPFFLFMHFFDPHAPYKNHPEFHLKLDLPYDQEIAFMDKHIGFFISYLKDIGLYDKSLIILFGDHGEGLGEHNEIGHGMFLYDSTLKVPLIIKLPYSMNKGMEVKQQVQLIDLMPTIFDLVGVKESIKLDGKSFVNSIIKNNNSNEFAYSETYYPFIHYGWSPLFSIRSNYFKFIYAPKRELYDIKNDPEELKNISATNSKITEDYYSILMQYANNNLMQFNKPAQLSIEEQEKLIALGYIGKSVSPEIKNKLADPKDKIELIKQMEKAKEFYYKGNGDQAINIIKSIVDKDKNMMGAWFLLGECFAKNKDYNSAILAFKEVIRIDPQNSFALFNLGIAYQKIQNYKEAIFWYKKAIDVDKSFFKAYVNLGEVLYFSRQFNESFDYLSRALKLRSGLAEVHNYLAGIYLQRNDLEKAKENIIIAKKINSDLPLLNFHLGLLDEKENKLAEAIQAYKKEYEINPNNHSALNNLGIVYAKKGMYDEAEDVFRKLIEIRKNDWKAYILLANVLYKKGERGKEINELIIKAEQLRKKSN